MRDVCLTVAPDGRGLLRTQRLKYVKKNTYFCRRYNLLLFNIKCYDIRISLH
jgi:hypothetical protein